jgi:hypothetical protein
MKGKRRKTYNVFVCKNPACGKTFERRPGRGDGSYCGNGCRDEDRSNGAMVETVRVVKVFPCRTCGRYFNPTREGRKGPGYCSDPCGAAGKKASRHKWALGRPIVGGTTIRRRDGYRCRMCGFEHFTEVHHIVPRREGGRNTADNMLSLCPNHHRAAHAGIVTKAELAAVLAEPLRFAPLPAPLALVNTHAKVA